MPNKDHKYDWLACNHAYIAFWKEKALLSKSKLDEEIKEIKKEKEQFLFEQEKGQWIRREEVVSELVRRIHVLKSDLLSLVKRLPQQSKEKEIVKKAVMSILKNYSQLTGVFKK
jgi:hypothetical protein